LKAPNFFKFQISVRGTYLCLISLFSYKVKKKTRGFPSHGYSWWALWAIFFSVSYLTSNLVPKRTKYVNPLIFKDLLRKKRRPWRNRNFRGGKRNAFFVSNSNYLTAISLVHCKRFPLESSLSKENVIYLLDLFLPPNVRYEMEQRSIDYSQNVRI
jgi:hypothetical protein